MKKTIENLIKTVKDIEKTKGNNLLIIISTKLERAVFTEDFISKASSVEDLFPNHRVMVKEYLNKSYIVTEIIEET